MGVHCYLTELGTLVTMAAKIVSVVAALATLAAGEPGYGGVAYHPYGGSSYTHRSPQGLHGYLHKREAEASYGYGTAYHPYGGYSYTHRSPQGLHGYLHKREADASYGYNYGPSSASVRVSAATPSYGYNPASYTYG